MLRYAIAPYMTTKANVSQTVRDVDILIQQYFFFFFYDFVIHITDSSNLDVLSKTKNKTQQQNMSDLRGSLPADKKRSSYEKAWSGGEIFAVVTFLVISCATTIFAIWYINKEKTDSPSSCSDPPYMAKWYSGPVTPIRGISSPETEIQAIFPEPFSSPTFFSAIIVDNMLSKTGQSHVKSVDGFKSTILTKYKIPNETEISDGFELNSNSIWTIDGSKKLIFAGTMSTQAGVSLTIFTCKAESSVISFAETEIENVGFVTIAHAFDFSHLEADGLITGILLGEGSSQPGIYVVYDAGLEGWSEPIMINLTISSPSFDPPCFYRIFGVASGFFFCAGEVQPNICYCAQSVDGSGKIHPMLKIQSFRKDDSYSTRVLDIMPLPPALGVPDQALIAYYDGSALYSTIISGVESSDGAQEVTISSDMIPNAHTFGRPKDGVVPLYVLFISRTRATLLMKQYNYDISAQVWDWGAFVMTIDHVTYPNTMNFNIMIIPDPWNVTSRSGAVCVQNVTLHKALVLPIKDDSIRAPHDPFYISSDMFSGSSNWTTSGTRLIFPINDAQKTQAFEIIDYGREMRLRVTRKIDISYISFGQ